ncbi:MAG: hypothetical protein R3C99_00695 [Pirellulaceae bacterium]
MVRRPLWQFEVYVARHDAGGWQQLAGSVEQGGVSNTPASSRYPSITVDAGRENQSLLGPRSRPPDRRVCRCLGSGGRRRARRLGYTWRLAIGRWNQRQWLGHSSANRQHGGWSACRLDGSCQRCDQRACWRFDGATWVGLGGSETGSVSAATSDVSQLAVATDGTKIAVAWTQAIGGIDQFYLREFDGSDWQQLAGKRFGQRNQRHGRRQPAPTLAYHNGELFVAWQQADTDLETPGDDYSARFIDGNWQAG